MGFCFAPIGVFNPKKARLSNPITVCHDDLDWSTRAVVGEGS